MVIFCFNKNMSFWKVVEETRLRQGGSTPINERTVKTCWGRAAVMEYYARGISWAGALSPEEEQSGVHPRILEGAQDPSCLSVRWLLPLKKPCLMQGWATLFFEAKRIFPHYPWKTNMSLMEGETQAVPVFMAVSEYIGGSQQVH